MAQKKKEIILKSLATGQSITGACLTAGIPRRTAYNWRDSDQEFRVSWDEAVEAGTDLMEDEMLRRATQGTERPVFYRGEACGSLREFSDVLLIFSLKARRPDKYREIAKPANQTESTSQLDTLISQMDEVSARIESDIKERVN